MMSFIFAPAVKNKSNLQNMFTSVTLPMKLPPPLPLPNNLGIYICLLTFVFVFLFLLGFSIRCETTVAGDLAKVTKMAHGGKPFSLFGYILMTNGET